MDKREALWLVIICAIAIVSFAFLYQGNQNNSVQNATGQNTSEQNPAGYEPPVTLSASAQDTYINIKNGTPSRIFLVDSSATFGTFAADHVDQWFPGPNGTYYIEASKGDRFVSINGTLRSDYNRSYWIFINASIYDTDGKQIGSLLRSSGRPEFKYDCLFIESNGTGQFHLLFKLDKQYTFDDIGRYEITTGEPMTIPPP